MKRVCVFLADGFEEVEALTPIDYLRRAGIEVTCAAVGCAASGTANEPAGWPVAGSHGITVEADSGIDEIASGKAGSFDAIVLPGGKRGSANLAASTELMGILHEQAASGRIIAAICAAPAVVLHSAAHLLRGRSFTGYPGTETQVTGAVFVPDRVVVDGSLITARAAGCAGEFSAAIIAALLGPAKAEEIAQQVLLDR